jgi:UMF1 family MFS transporter
MRIFRTNKKIFSWAMYDWANSTFATTVMAGFFPLFFKQFWSHGTDPTLTTARLGSAISIGSFIMAVLSPGLGALADKKGYKKLFCFLFMLLGIAGSASMTWIPQGAWWMALVAYTVASVGFNASCSFYDGLLPAVASAHEADYASSLGYGLGYLGGGLLFSLNVWMYLSPSTFFLHDQTQAVQISFLTVALWWGIFSLPLFKNVPEPAAAQPETSLWRSGYESLLKLKSTLSEMLREKNLFYFLLAYWLYIDGVYTVMTMAVDFGISLHLPASSLIASLLLVQFIGFPFALVFSWFSKKWGCRIPILISIAVYGLTVIGATFMSAAWHFTLLAIIIGVVQGGVQALSRSLFARMVPLGESGEYFGLFNLVGKFASVLGPILVGWGTYLTGDPRRGLLGLLVLFTVGGSLLWKVQEPRRQDEGRA